MKHKIYFRAENADGRKYRRTVRLAINTALEEESVDTKCEINVLFTDDSGIREINRDFRDMDKSTDVLSFPMQDFTPGEFDGDYAERDPETRLVPLGDMVISLEQAERQAEEIGNFEEREVAYLTVHSVLHLLGYDHVDEGEMKRQMRTREKHIMLKMGMGHIAD